MQKCVCAESMWLGLYNPKRKKEKMEEKERNLSLPVEEKEISGYIILQIYQDPSPLFSQLNGNA